MTRKLTTLIAAAATFAIALVSTACGSTAYSSSGYGAPTAATTATRVSAATVGVRHTSLGRVIVDSKGHTLYLFEKDKNGKSACTGSCATAWPPVLTSGKPSATAGVKVSLLGTTRRADGRLQVTYNHHPLYTFVKDTTKGQASGENVDAFGAEWYAVSAAGAKVEKRSGDADTTATSGSSGYGY